MLWIIKLMKCCRIVMIFIFSTLSFLHSLKHFLKTLQYGYNGAKIFFFFCSSSLQISIFLFLFVVCGMMYPFSRSTMSSSGKIPRWRKSWCYWTTSTEFKQYNQQTGFLLKQFIGSDQIIPSFQLHKCLSCEESIWLV